MLTKSCGIATALLLCAAFPATAGTILTFDITGIADHQNVNQGYGDRVTGPTDAVGSYGTNNGIYTPNVVVGYGATGEDPALYRAGYGDLTNVLINDTDSDTTLTTTFTADAGFLVNLVSFDIASFINAGQTIRGARVLDAGNNSVLWSVGSTFITGATHLSLAPNVSASSLLLEIDLTGLGGLSDDIGLDNILFEQAAAPVPTVPEPTTLSMLGFGLVAVARKYRQNRARA